MEDLKQSYRRRKRFILSEEGIQIYSPLKEAEVSDTDTTH